MTTMRKQRYTGLDLARAIAIACVVGGHFFMNSGFPQAEFAGASMFAQGMAKFFFGMGVPLFLMLTGYLNSRKEARWKYYRGGARVLASYLFFAALTILFRKYCLGHDFSWGRWAGMVLSFDAIPYGWYIEMWIGLFLLTPFLNILWRHAPDRRLKLALLATLYVMTALPDLTNRYGMHLLPDYWKECYPLFFFFAGSYIKEYQPKPRNCYSGGGILLLCLINPVFNMLFMKGHSMIQIAGDPAGAFGAPMAILFFLLLYRAETGSPWVRKGLESVSRLSLDMYLCSYAFDAWLYPAFKARFYESQGQFGLFFFVLVPLILCGTYLVSLAKDAMFRMACFAAGKLLKNG